MLGGEANPDHADLMSASRTKDVSLLRETSPLRYCSPRLYATSSPVHAFAAGVTALTWLGRVIHSQHRAPRLGVATAVRNHGLVSLCIASYATELLPLKVRHRRRSEEER
jgi:hypothetical protein